jgi:hypothetical protein
LTPIEFRGGRLRVKMLSLSGVVRHREESYGGSFEKNSFPE